MFDFIFKMALHYILVIIGLLSTK